MSADIKIRKGLNIKLIGESDKLIKETPASSVYGITPPEFHGITPRMRVKMGDNVKIGTPLFASKENEDILFPSTVSGEVVDIIRGEKRKVLGIRILPDTDFSSEDFGSIDYKSASPEDIKKYFLQSGVWPFIMQRPYDVVANPNKQPRDIFISAFNSAPIAPDYDYALKGKEKELQAAVTALSKLTSGKVHITLSNESTVSPFNNLNHIEKHYASGPHPVGNVSTQIAKVHPISKGEIIWTVKPSDLVIIGELLLTGKLNFTRIIALSGSEVENPHYVKVVAGAQLKDIVAGNLKTDEESLRIIDGNVLTGSKKEEDDFLGFYTDQVTVIPEGDDYDFMGWQTFQLNKFSTFRAGPIPGGMFSWLNPNKKYRLSANTNGEHRAFVLTGKFEKVMPLDIYPMELLKACMTNDLDKMEMLGIYEVAPEDFALTEFVDVSKHNHQDIIRKGLDLMIKEVG